MSNEFIKLDRQIKFMESHVGGDLNDTQPEFASQREIIQNNNNLYLDLLDDTNNLLRNKDVQNMGNNSSEYIQEKRKEFYTIDTRINNVPTTVNFNDVNVSNPIIYPKEYDPYFEYLHKKNLKSINTQIIQKKTYVNIDSANRVTQPTMSVLSYIKLVSNPLIFTNSSNTLQIKLNNANNLFSVGDRLTLQGFNFYTVNYKNINFYFKNQSNQVVIDLTPNYIYQIPYYNVMIEISGITNNGSEYFMNIPLNVLNDVQTVNLYTTSSNEIKFIFTIPMNFYSDNINSNVLISSCSIKYYYIGNYPINYINSGVPTTLYNLNPYLIVDFVDSSSIYAKLTNPISLINSDSMQITGNWINYTTFETGGNNVQIGLIKTIESSYLKPSSYRLILKKRIDNIVCIKMKSSEIPNTNKLVYNIPQTNTISVANNVFYWENALDAENNIYSIQIPPGNYTSIELSTLMENLISQVPKIINNTNMIPINKIKVNINQANNITQLTSYNQYSLPNCIINLNTPDSLTWILTINHPYHNQNIGSVITIENCINYKNIDAKYINGNQTITEILGNDSYNITLKNINPLNYFTDGGGGFSIIISTLNSFKIFFDKSDTIGTVLGFKSVGQQGSITPFSSQSNNFIIDNSQPYIFGTENIQIINNNLQNIQSSNDFNFDVGRYILIKCSDNIYNQCLSPNGIPYFYKILLNGQPGTIMFNTFVDNPIYFNPPLKYLEYFDFTFISDTGIEFEFYGINNSMTFEITTITNIPENTNLATYIARI
jgi:hypothetical protein